MSEVRVAVMSTVLAMSAIFAAGVYLASADTALQAASSESNVQKLETANTPIINGRHLVRYVDRENNVTCWGVGNSLSCLPNWMLVHPVVNNDKVLDDQGNQNAKN